MKSARGSSEESLESGLRGRRTMPRGAKAESVRNDTDLSHLSLLFLQGSQLIALRARLGGGRASSPPLSTASFRLLAPGPGERTRTCFVLGADPDGGPDAATAGRWPLEFGD